jgi:hypothetical protein
MVDHLVMIIAPFSSLDDADDKKKYQCLFPYLLSFWFVDAFH